MIDKWLERERPFVRKTEELQNFSEQLAIDLYQKREERGSERIHYSELEPWARSFGINLKDWQLRGRSLLNRDVAGNYKFAHRSIMEYLFVKRFLEIPPEHRFQMKWTDQMYQFLIEIMRHQLLISQKLPDFTNIELKGLASLKPMPFFILRKNKKRIKDNEVEAMIKKFDFFDSTKNNKGKGIPHLYMKFKQEKDEIFIVDYTTGLIWQQSGSSERMGYEQIKRWIQDLNQKGFAGYHDWRLPTLEEAMSLLEPAKKNADLYIDPIFDSKQWWISTIDSVQDTSGQWVVGFGSGYCFPDISLNYVRAVRSEQSSPKSFYNKSDGPRAHSTIFKD